MKPRDTEWTELEAELHAMKPGVQSIEPSEPPDLLDQRVLNQARRAIGSNSRRPWSFGWPHAASTAAVIVLGLTVVLQLRQATPEHSYRNPALGDEDGAAITAQPPAAMRPEALRPEMDNALKTDDLNDSPAAQKAEGESLQSKQLESGQRRATNNAQDTLGAMNENPARLQKAAESKSSSQSDSSSDAGWVDAVEAPNASSDEQPRKQEFGRAVSQEQRLDQTSAREQPTQEGFTDNPDAAPDSADPVPARQRLNRPAAPVAIHEATANSASEDKDSASMDRDQRSEAQANVASEAVVTKPVSGLQVEAFEESEMDDKNKADSLTPLAIQNDPAAWLAHIRARRLSGENNQWQAQLQAFMVRYPDHPIPEDLKPHDD